jgi:hypothetical protein
VSRVGWRNGEPDGPRGEGGIGPTGEKRGSFPFSFFYFSAFLFSFLFSNLILKFQTQFYVDVSDLNMHNQKGQHDVKYKYM